MSIAESIGALGAGPLTEESLREHVFPLFSRALQRKEIYLANHSLGRPPDRMADDVRGALDAWYTDMDSAWGPWLAEMTSFRANIAKLIGCARSDAVVPKTAAGQGLRAVLNAITAPTIRVVATRGEFDSIDFILKTYEMRSKVDVRWVEPVRAEGPPRIDIDDVIFAAREHRPHLVIVSQVYFVTGQVLGGIEDLCAFARQRDALVMVDTYHSAGVIPVRFDAMGADFAIGGSYKYLRGGPGACWLAIHPKHLDDPRHELRTLDTGWFAKRDTFKYKRTAVPEFADGGDAWLESTPAVLPFYQAKAGLEFVLAIGVERLREYSLKQQAFLVKALESRGVRTAKVEPRGAFVLVEDADAHARAERLRGAGLNVDARQGYVRLCPDVLTTEAEMARAGEIVVGTK
jgi:kynureninase